MICKTIQDILLVSILCCLMGTSLAGFSAVFAFGDANVEVGNNEYINTTLKTDFPPFGVTYFGHPSGRVTDGRITIDFLMSYMNLPFLDPYLKPDGNFTHGVNFGSGGAAALSVVDMSENRGVPLDQQIAYFYVFKESLNGSKPSGYFQDALYYIQIAEVDYLAMLLVASETSLVLGLGTIWQSAIIASIQSAIQQLYEAGGRNFLVFNVYPLGCVPLLLAAYNKTNGSCVSEANTLVQSHNSALSDLVDSLQGTFVDSQILLVHSDDVLNEVEKDPIGYGFEDTKEACCGGGLFNGQIACGNSSYTLCKNPRERIYWDQVHNSEAFFEVVAESVWSGNGTVTPMNLESLFKLVN